MEKRIPHYPLSEVHRLIRHGKVRATVSAYNSASELGIYTLADMCDVVLAMNTADFYKSMTTHANHRLWQDVYHPRIAGKPTLYLKLTVIEEVLLVSFKER